MQKLVFAVGLMLLAASALQAQVVPKGNVFIGYSYLHQGMNSIGPTNMNGWNGSLEGRVFPFVGLVVDFSGHYGSLPPLPCSGGPCFRSDFKLYNVLLGPRLSVSIHGIRPFAHALFGVAHESQGGGSSGVSDNSFSTAIGGGVDFKLAPIIGWRVQADALRTSLFGSSSVNLRASTGLVLRF